MQFQSFRRGWFVYFPFDTI